MLKQGGWVFFIILAIMTAGFFCTQEIEAVGLININTATVEELDTLPGIGPAKAQEIINYRASVGLFQKIEDIMNVTGIKQATFDSLKDLITVGGDAALPVCGNAALEAGEGCDDGNLTDGDGCSSGCTVETVVITPPPDQTATSTGDVENPPSLPAQAGPSLSKGTNNLGDVLINEFVSDPADNEVEWIELYNKTSQEIDLTGWWLEDGSKAKTNLTGSLGLSDLNRYKIIDKPSGNLNNSGDLIVLHDSAGKIIDQVVYGNWPDGNLSDNAPVAHDPESLARKFDGYNTFNNANDFAVTLEPTKGSSNLIQAEDEVSQEARAGFDFSNDIYLSELLPNPAGDDAKLEFIEIYNAGAREVNLTGWSLSNEDEKKVNLEKIATGTLIRAGEYLAFFRPRTKIVLHNDQGEVRLFQPLADKPAQTVAYKNVKEGWSYVKTNLSELKANLANNVNTEWQWSELPTPGAVNVVQTQAASRVIEVEFSFPENILTGQPAVFDSSDTGAPDGARLKYAWDFGDGFKNILANPEHTFFKAGIYEVRLAVSDSQTTAEKVKSVKVANNVGELSGEATGLSAVTPRTPLLKGGEGGIIINEIFPDPAGADTGQEMAELKNQGAEKLNLANWRLENSNGRYKFKNDAWLEEDDFYLLTNTVSKLAFKNSSDVISLYNDLDELIDRVEYSEAVQGEAYARGENGKWFWTTKLTPGRDNIISLAGSKSAIVLSSVSSARVEEADYTEASLEQAKELEIASLVKVKGTVAVLPGILGTQVFYVVSSSTGLQVYNYKKDFPALTVGDYLEVSGELAQTQGEARIKTKAKSDMAVKEHGAPPPALELSCDQVNEENIGQLLRVSGEITDKKSSTLYLDDGSGEILIYIKQAAGISTKNLTPGQAVSVTGILGKTSTGLRLMPRSEDDIIKAGDAGGPASPAGGLEPQVLGEVASSGEWAIAERDKKIELFKYLLIIAGAVIIVLIGLFIRAARKTGS